MVKIIAEFCQNHNGDFNILEEMVHQASDNGATHAKIQTIFADNLTFRAEFEEDLFDKNGKRISIKRPYYDEYRRLKNLEIDKEQSIKFINICNKYNLVPMTTCFSRTNIKDIVEAGFKSIKVASYDCASYKLIRELRDSFEELIISTGATFDDEIENTSQILENSNYSFLHCVTLYPTPLNEMHLNRMQWLRQFTPDVGLSDHTLFARDGIEASLAALALGANLVERHFTILPPNETKDGPVSINSSALKSISEFSKLNKKEMLEHLENNYPNWRKMLGESQRILSDEEILNRNYYRGRFASPRKESENGKRMIFNWEETPLI